MRSPISKGSCIHDSSHPRMSRPPQSSRRNRSTPLDRRHRRAPERVAVEVDQAVSAPDELACGSGRGRRRGPSRLANARCGSRVTVASRSSVGTTHAVASHAGRSSRSAGGGPGTKVAMPSARSAARPRVGDRGDQSPAPRPAAREQGELVGVHAERLVAVAEVGAVEHRPARVAEAPRGCRARARSRASSCRTRSRRAWRSSAARIATARADEHVVDQLGERRVGERVDARLDREPRHPVALDVGDHRQAALRAPRRRSRRACRGRTPARRRR